MESGSAGPSTPQEMEEEVRESSVPSTSEPEKGPRKGVELVLESNDDWKIQEIGYDGVERYMKPETFTDNVGKLARKVEWMKLVNPTNPYENAKVDPQEKLDDEVNYKKRAGKCQLY